MPTIKCPVCGQAVDDHTPVCPHCGTLIAGRLTTCRRCGNVYLSDLTACPACHEPNPNRNEEATPPRDVPPAPPVPPQKKGNGKVVAIVALAIVLLLGAGVLFYQSHEKKANEQQAYELVMKSDDPQQLQDYLDKYTDADPMHRQAVEKRLEELKKLEADWNDTLVNDSKTAYLQFLSDHPDAPQKDIIHHKIDSIDWSDAVKLNTIEGYQNYMDEHADGEHYDEATDNIKTIKTTVVQDDEAKEVKLQIREFFSAFNSQSDGAIVGCVSQVMTTFLGKSNATSDDVTEFMHSLWNKPELVALDWFVKDDYNIKKKEVGEDKYDYTVTFTVILNRRYTNSGSDTQDTYHVTAHINPDGLISSMEMKK